MMIHYHIFVCTFILLLHIAAYTLLLLLSSSSKKNTQNKINIYIGTYSDEAQFVKNILKIIIIKYNMHV